MIQNHHKPTKEDDMSNENNEPTGTTANVEDGILDLRPPKAASSANCCAWA